MDKSAVASWLPPGVIICDFCQKVEERPDQGSARESQNPRPDDLRPHCQRTACVPRVAPTPAPPPLGEIGFTFTLSPFILLEGTSVVFYRTSYGGRENPEHE